MKPFKTVLFLGDGMADEPIDSLGGKTPLEYAKTPWMDKIAKDGRSGTFLTLPDGFPTSSDVANMSVMGGDLATELCGRGPLEAASMGIELGADDVAFRMNLVSVNDDGTLKDFSAGHIDEAGQRAAIDLLNEKLGTEKIRFYAGVSYRNLVVLSGKEFSAEVAYDKPDDNQGNPVAEHLPRAKSPAGEHTAQVLRQIIADAGEVLKGCQANGVWPWSGGKAGAVHSIADLYGVKGAVVSAVDVINGLGRVMGLDVIKVPGATGYVDTNYEGKADAAIKAIEDGYDFVYVHIESTDEVSHEQNLELKLKAIEDFDSRLIGRVMAKLGDKAAYCVLPDHPVPIRLGKHTRTPVPFAVCQPGNAADGVVAYGERDALNGSLGALKGGELMDVLLKG
jgi:2,3-bisphosphoglycerate-independent phosphoglycerate mutase